MSKLIKALVDSDENCRWEETEFVHDEPLQEIYTCLTCIEKGVRQDERERIIKLAKNLEHRSMTHSELCTREHYFVEKLIAAIKGENK